MAWILISFTCTDFVSIYVLLRLYLDPNMPFGTQFVIIYMKDLKIIHIYRRPIPTIHEGNAQSISWSLSKGGYYIDQFLGLKGSGTGWWWFQLRASRQLALMMMSRWSHHGESWGTWLGALGSMACCSVLLSIAHEILYCPWDIVLPMWGFVWPSEHRTPGRKCTHNMGPICSSQPSAPTACFAHS